MLLSELINDLVEIQKRNGGKDVNVLVDNNMDWRDIISVNSEDYDDKIFIVLGYYNG